MKRLKEKSDEVKLLSLEARLWLKKTLIKAHPEWVDENGHCHKCFENYSSLSNLKDAVSQVYS